MVLVGVGVGVEVGVLVLVVVDVVGVVGGGGGVLVDVGLVVLGGGGGGVVSGVVVVVPVVVVVVHVVLCFLGCRLSGVRSAWPRRHLSTCHRRRHIPWAAHSGGDGGGRTTRHRDARAPGRG